MRKCHGFFKGQKGFLMMLLVGGPVGRVEPVMPVVEPVAPLGASAIVGRVVRLRVGRPV